jgi:hypothetical protein
MNHLMLERGLDVKQSTLGERAGMGLFATTDFKKKEIIDVFTGTYYIIPIIPYFPFFWPRNSVC